VAVMGIEVPHAHIHLIPIDDIGDLDFQKAQAADAADLAAIAERIRSALGA
jgi:histidine triad (HIT) family protein